MVLAASSVRTCVTEINQSGFANYSSCNNEPAAAGGNITQYVERVTAADDTGVITAEGFDDMAGFDIVLTPDPAIAAAGDMIEGWACSATIDAATNASANWAPANCRP
ncbi:pilin [Marinobacter sp. ATCH36]|nr:pilin [Marinobacter sp. ATCH36]